MSGNVSKLSKGMVFVKFSLVALLCGVATSATGKPPSLTGPFTSFSVVCPLYNAIVCPLYNAIVCPLYNAIVCPLYNAIVCPL